MAQKKRKRRKKHNFKSRETVTADEFIVAWDSFREHKTNFKQTGELLGVSEYMFKKWAVAVMENGFCLAGLPFIEPDKEPFKYFFILGHPNYNIGKRVTKEVFMGLWRGVNMGQDRKVVCKNVGVSVMTLRKWFRLAAASMDDDGKIDFDNLYFIRHDEK